MNYNEAKELIDKIKINSSEMTRKEFKAYDNSEAMDMWNPQYQKNLDLTYEKMINVLETHYNGTDVGGSYADWLMSFGIDYETENGWASFESFNHDNIKLFIYSKTEEIESELNLIIQKVQEEIKSIQKHVRIIPFEKNILKFIFDWYME